MNNNEMCFSKFLPDAFPEGGNGLPAGDEACLYRETADEMPEHTEQEKQEDTAEFTFPLPTVLPEPDEADEDFRAKGHHRIRHGNRKHRKGEVKA